SAPLPAGSWGTAGKPRSTRNVVQTNPEIAVRGMTCSWRLTGVAYGGLAAARYHTVAPERRWASQQKLRADVAFTSFPPSRRVRFAPRDGVIGLPAYG